MALKFITAEEAASYVHHNDNVGFVVLHPRKPESRSRSYARKAAENTLKVTFSNRYDLPAASTGDKPRRRVGSALTPSNSVHRTNLTETYVPH